MSHSDPELVALYALGETVEPAVVEHLSVCPSCREDAVSLRRVVEMSLAASGDVVGPQAPPRAVWERIAHETSIDPALLPYDGGGSPAVSRLADVPDLAARRARRGNAGPVRGSWLVAASVAALGLAVGVGGTLLWETRDGSGEQVTASVDMAPLGSQGLSGGAEVVTVSSTREIVVRLDKSTIPDGFLEVWLLSPDASAMVSLGVLDGDEGTFALPPELDLASYPLVDVSLEKYDGNPLHSGDSISRGDLDGARA